MVAWAVLTVHQYFYIDIFSLVDVSMVSLHCQNQKF